MTDQANSPSSGTEDENPGGGADTTGGGGGSDTITGGGGGEKTGDEGKSWLDGLNLPDELRQNPVVTKFAASPEGMVRSLIHLQGHYGVPAEQLVRLPKPDDAEGVAKLWNTLGRPETPDKYGLKAPEGSDVDQAALDSFLATLHKAGPLTPDMAKAATDWYGAYAQQVKAQGDAQFAEFTKASEQSLRRDWGAAYDQNMDAAAEVAERFGGKEYLSYLKESGLGSDPRHLKMLAEVAKVLGEPGSADAGGRARKPGGVMSPAEAEAELAKFSDTNSIEYKALHDGNHPQHDHFLARRNELFALKRGRALG